MFYPFSCTLLTQILRSPGAKHDELKKQQIHAKKTTFLALKFAMSFLKREFKRGKIPPPTRNEGGEVFFIGAKEPC